MFTIYVLLQEHCARSAHETLSANVAYNICSLSIRFEAANSTLHLLVLLSLPRSRRSSLQNEFESDRN